VQFICSILYLSVRLESMHLIFCLKGQKGEIVTIIQSGPRKSSPSQGQLHAIEDGQRWGGVGNADSTTVD
jgi:hypothetical protein